MNGVKTLHIGNLENKNFFEKQTFSTNCNGAYLPDMLRLLIMLLVCVCHSGKSCIVAVDNRVA